MQQAKPVYIIALIMAVLAYVVGTCIALCDIYGKVGRLEHNVFHLLGNRVSCEAEAH